jgi:hypothetical protein
MAPVAVMAQTPEPADFPMSVAYCLGVTLSAQKHISPDPNEQAFYDTRVARLRAYVISKMGDPQWRLGIPLALNRGTTDAESTLKLLSRCTSIQDIDTCIPETLRQAGSEAVAARERLMRCEQVSTMLPF